MGYDVAWEVTLDDFDSPVEAARVAEQVVSERESRFWTVKDRATGETVVVNLATGEIKK